MARQPAEKVSSRRTTKTPVALTIRCGRLRIHALRKTIHHAPLVPDDGAGDIDLADFARFTQVKGGNFAAASHPKHIPGAENGMRLRIMRRNSSCLELPQFSAPKPFCIHDFVMPGSFDDFGVRFLYPENWKIVDQTEPAEDAAAGVTLETPEGAFFSLNRYPGGIGPETVIEEAIVAMRAEYDEIEVGPYEDPSGDAGESGAELHFYYLDLMIAARLLAIPEGNDVLLIQMQGESRDFDRLEPVFGAMLKSLRDSIA